MSISVVIPHCPSGEHDALLKRCLESLPPLAERIVVVNEKNTIGFTKAVNYGLRIATGDYVMVVNNDIVWKEGLLEDLCVADVITSPKMNGQPQVFWGCFFVIPRSIIDRIGLLDERFYLYCSDTDLVMRAKQERVELRSIQSCNIETEGGRTTCRIDGREAIDFSDTQKFVAKWKIRPDAALG